MIRRTVALYVEYITQIKLPTRLIYRLHNVIHMTH